MADPMKSHAPTCTGEFDENCHFCREMEGVSMAILVVIAVALVVGLLAGVVKLGYMLGLAIG